MADTFTSDTYDALCQEAEGYLARGLAEQARELLLKAASLIGTRPRARSLLADACMSLGLWDEARFQLETLTTLEVDNYHNHFRLGQVLEELTENQLARDNYNVVLDHNPDHHGAKVALSRIESSDDSTDVNLASFFATGSGSTGNEPEAPPGDSDSDSDNVIASVFGSTQVFPDAQTDDVFAGDEDIEQDVDKLLKDLGVDGDTQETSGAVSELLSSLGITPDGEKEAEKEIEKVDISSILSTESVPEDEKTATGEVEPEPEPALPTEVSQDETTILKSAFEATPEDADSDAEPKDEVVALESVFSAPSEEAGVDELEQAVPLQSDSGTEAETPPVLESVFSAAQEEAVEIPVASEPPAEEPPAEEPAVVEASAEEPPPDDEKKVGMLESLFGSTIEETPPEPVIVEAPPEPAAEEPVVAEAPPEPAAEEPVVAEAPPEPAAEEPVALEAPPEPVAEEPVVAEAPPEPAVEEPVVAEVPQDEAVSEPPEVTEPAVYTIHKPDFESLVIVELEKGTLAIRQAYIAAMDSRLKLETDEGKRLLSGFGTIWVGQGDRTPVIISIQQGMFVRSDRMILFDSCVIESAAGIPEIPALVRLEAPDGSEMLCFAGGRIREISLPADRTTLTVRSGSLLAAGKDIEIKPDSSDFLTLSGHGRIYISG